MTAVMMFATGGATKSGCEDCPCVYSTTVCCPMKTTIRVLCLILLILTFVEMALDLGIIIIAWNAEEFKGQFGQATRRRDTLSNIKVVGPAALLFGCLRLGSIYYMYRTLKDEVTQSEVITARGLCICTSTFNTILGSIFIFYTLLMTWNYDDLREGGPNDLNTNTWDAKIVSTLLLAVLCVDFAFLVSYALCVVETYRTSVLQANDPGIRMRDWANRDNDKYKVVAPRDEETPQ